MRITPRRLAACAFAAGLLGYGLAAAPAPFYTKGEGREAMAVRALLEGPSLVLPQRPELPIPAKPPLFHWLAAAATATGVRPVELAIRLPSVVLGAAGVALTAAVGATLHGPTAGVLAAVVLGTSFEWLRAATQSRVDMTLTFFLVLAVLACQAAATGRGGRATAALGTLAAALAVLAKGPVGVVLPALVVGADALVAREPRRLLRVVHLPAALVAAGLCVGWYVLAWRAGGEAFVERQLLHENLRRFLGSGEMEHAHSALYYVPALAGGLFPWTLVLPFVAVRLRRAPPQALRFLLTWAGVVLAFYAFAGSKRSAYLLPLYPALALLAGAALAGALETAPGPIARRCLGALVALLVALAAFVAVRGTASIPAVLLGPLGGRDETALPTAVGLVAALRLPIALVLAAIALALPATLRGTPRQRLATLVCVALLWVGGLGALGTLPLARALTPRRFVEQVRTIVGPEDRLCALGNVDDAFRFYLGRPLLPCSGRCAEWPSRTFVVRQRSYDAGRREACLALRLVDQNPAGQRLQLDEARPPVSPPAAGSGRAPRRCAARSARRSREARLRAGGRAPPASAATYPPGAGSRSPT